MDAFDSDLSSAVRVPPMVPFDEPFPELVAPNPGGTEDPLGESVLDPRLPGLRVFEPTSRRVVIGRGQDPRREVRLDACHAASVPVHRRASGGGTVVLAPGMVVVALRLAGGLHAPDDHFALVNAALVPAVEAACGARPACRGHGDLAVRGADGIERKVLGASLRQSTHLAIYLGVFLVDDAVPLMEGLLAHPSREPGYRAGRDHRAFCTHLSAHGCSVPRLIAELAPRLAPLIGASPVAPPSGGTVCGLQPAAGQ
jgi:lipoate-protein ligase A